MSSFTFDLRDAFRGLRRDRAYAATVILTLALTIGATTAIFSIVNGVLLKPLAYRESHRLVAVREVWKQFPGTLEVNEQHFEYWRQHARSFESMAQYIALPANLTGAGEAAQIRLVHSTGSLFDVLQVDASIGRTLKPADEAAGTPDVVAIADLLWRERFGSDAGIIGRAISLDGRPYTVVGVLPAEMHLPESDRLRVDAFVVIRVDEDHVGWVGDHNNAAIGRLKAGVTPEQANAELDVLQAQVSELAAKQAHEPVVLASVVTPLTEAVVGRARRGLLLLLAAIAAVLLIACSNLANLSLTRTVGRLRDAAIRSALGASRARLAGRAVLEQLILSTIGGAIGLWIASLALSMFVRTAPIDLPRVTEVALDPVVLGFAAAVSMLTALLVALVPAWRLGGRSVQTALRSGGTITPDRGGMRTRAALLMLQVALSVTLLVVTTLLTVSFIRVMNIDRGFVADRVLAVDVALPATRYADDAVRLAAYDRMLEAVHGLPGVVSATTTSMLPLRGQGQVNFIVAAGDTRPRAEQPTANFRFIGPEYFSTLGIRLVRGRSFTDGERNPDRPLPSVISERTAAQLWPGQDALGKVFSRGNSDEEGFEVVGVVADARMTSIERTPPLMVYLPYWWRQRRASTSLLVKTASADPASLLPAIRRAVRNIDPEIAIGQTRPLDQLVDAAFAARRYQMRLFVTFGVVALLIAVIGIYAVTAYGVSRRRREMNIRVAIGASASHVWRLILRDATVPLAAGVAAGAAGAVALGSVVAALLFGVQARDPVVIAGVVGLVATVGVTASLLAARQGLSIDPAAALRDE
jgi:putative ABC transport system permease protein